MSCDRRCFEDDPTGGGEDCSTCEGKDGYKVQKYNLNSVKKFGDELLDPLKLEVNTNNLDKQFDKFDTVMKQSKQDLMQYLNSETECEMLTLIAKKDINYIKDLRKYCDRLIEHYDEPVNES